MQVRARSGSQGNASPHFVYSPLLFSAPSNLLPSLSSSNIRQEHNRPIPSESAQEQELMLVRHTPRALFQLPPRPAPCGHSEQILSSSLGKHQQAGPEANVLAAQLSRAFEETHLGP